MADVCCFCHNPLGGSYTYHWSRACHHECVPMDEKDRRLAAALTRTAALEAQLAERVKVKPLEWHKSEIIGWNGDWHTVPTSYSIRCADENGWKWSGFGGFGYGRSDEAAKAAAQADYERRILSALEATPPAPKVTEGAWRYEIKHGPEGEANYAFVYDQGGHLVSNLKVHHAIAVVAAMNATLTAAQEAGR
jgi:hypothetical protein